MYKTLFSAQRRRTFLLTNESERIGTGYSRSISRLELAGAQQRATWPALSWDMGVTTHNKLTLRHKSTDYVKQRVMYRIAYSKLEHRLITMCLEAGHSVSASRDIKVKDHTNRYFFKYLVFFDLGDFQSPDESCWALNYLQVVSKTIRHAINRSRDRAQRVGTVYLNASWQQVNGRVQHSCRVDYSLTIFKLSTQFYLCKAR